MYVTHTLLPAQLMSCRATICTLVEHVKEGRKGNKSSLRNKLLFSKKYMLCYLSLK